MPGRTRRRDDGSAAQGRLDPVRWRPPGRGTLIRLATVAVLLGTAAVAVWHRPPDCPPGQSATTPSCPSASSGSASTPATDTAGTDGATRTNAATTRDDAAATDGAPATNSAPATGDPTGTGGGGPPRRAVPPGTVGVPVQLVEQVTVRLLRAGDRVDLYAVASPGAAPAPVARNSLVLAVTGADDVSSGLLLALPPEAAKLTQTTPHRSGFDVLVRATEHP